MFLKHQHISMISEESCDTEDIAEFSVALQCNILQ